MPWGSGRFFLCVRPDAVMLLRIMALTHHAGTGRGCMNHRTARVTVMGLILHRRACVSLRGRLFFASFLWWKALVERLTLQWCSGDPPDVSFRRLFMLQISVCFAFSLVYKLIFFLSSLLLFPFFPICIFLKKYHGCLLSKMPAAALVIRDIRLTASSQSIRWRCQLPVPHTPAFVISWTGNLEWIILLAKIIDHYM